jgi:RimJ/RimL family protein N-acetyltransferase
MNHKNTYGQPIGSPVSDWQGCEFPPRSAMSGKWCRLEILVPEKHAEELFAAYVKQRNDQDWTYLPYGPFEHFDDYQNWLTKACCGDDPLFHTIIEAETNKAVGVASFLRIQPVVGVIEVGHIHFSPLLQKTPVATEAMFLMMSRVFDELGYRRYEWKCDALNAPSRKAAERFGFSFEGVFRQVTMYKNRNRDTAWFGIIDKDWPILKKAFQTWLKPDNFDTQGRQKKSLQQIRENLH